MLGDQRVGVYVADRREREAHRCTHEATLGLGTVLGSVELGHAGLFDWVGAGAPSLDPLLASGFIRRVTHLGHVDPVLLLLELDSLPGWVAEDNVEATARRIVMLNGVKHL